MKVELFAQMQRQMVPDRALVDRLKRRISAADKQKKWTPRRVVAAALCGAVLAFGGVLLHNYMTKTGFFRPLEGAGEVFVGLGGEAIAPMGPWDELLFPVKNTEVKWNGNRYDITSFKVHIDRVVRDLGDAEAKGTEYLVSPDGRGPSFRIRYTTVPAYAVQSLRPEDYIVVYVSAERSFYLCWRMDAELETTLQEAYELLGMDRLTQPAAPGGAGASSAPSSSVTAST